jgi:hypothetical protein
MLDDIAMPSNHGGLVFPLDMFRPTMLAAALAEGLIAQARNIVDAKLELTRHPEIQLVLARIVGTVVDDPAKFWRENVELGLIASQVLPRQLFVYWVATEPEPRQGFIVAQRGQVLAAQDATADQLPPDATAADWPVAQLLMQLQLDAEELADGFYGGPRVELSLMDREGDDRQLLMTLVGQQPSEAEAPPAAGAKSPGQKAQPQQKPRAPAQPPADEPRASKRVSAEEDRKRRAAEHQAELDARQAKAESIHADLPYLVDELGVVVAPKGAELSDTDILAPYVISKLDGEVPRGLPPELQDRLQGKRVDFAVPVAFASEVFLGDKPLSKPTFEAQAQAREVGGRAVKVLEVLGPRLGRGSYIRGASGGVFVSRTPDMQLPESLIVALLER